MRRRLFRFRRQESRRVCWRARSPPSRRRGRTKHFALRIVAGTSVGASYREAYRGGSKAVLRVDPPSVISDANRGRGMVFIPLLERLRRPSSVSQRQRLQQLLRNFAAVLRQLF